MNWNLMFKEDAPKDYPNALWGYRPAAMVTIIQTTDNPKNHQPPIWIHRFFLYFLTGTKIIKYLRDTPPVRVG